MTKDEEDRRKAEAAEISRLEARIESRTGVRMGILRRIKKVNAATRGAVTVRRIKTQSLANMAEVHDQGFSDAIRRNRQVLRGVIGDMAGTYPKPTVDADTKAMESIRKIEQHLRPRSERFQSPQGEQPRVFKLRSPAWIKEDWACLRCPAWIKRAYAHVLSYFVMEVIK